VSAGTSDPLALLAALDDPRDVDAFVTRSIAEGTWPALAYASRVLRLLASFAREDGVPVPVRVTERLAEVRAAMRALRGRTESEGR
jgi:hypothetical protein